MNAQKRSSLRQAQTYLAKALQIVADVRDDERDALDNTPVNLQNSERYTVMEQAVDELDEAIDHLSSADASIDQAVFP